jgi:SNF2 family DNA or RNA helicase
MLSELRVLLIYDEPQVKLKNRKKNQTYRAHEFFVNQIRRHGELRVLGLSATPMDKDFEDVFNAERIIAPHLAGKVSEFEEQYVEYRDDYGQRRWKNTCPEDRVNPNVVLFPDRFQPIMLRRRKTDPELIEHFPKRVEEFLHTRLADEHLKLYESVQRTYEGTDEGTQRSLFMRCGCWR